jgi:hypothetical protein
MHKDTCAAPEESAPLLKSTVELVGFESIPELTGQTGTAYLYDKASSQYAVWLHNPSCRGDDDQTPGIVIKPQNIRKILHDASKKQPSATHDENCDPAVSSEELCETGPPDDNTPSSPVLHSCAYPECVALGAAFDDPAVLDDSLKILKRCSKW